MTTDKYRGQDGRDYVLRWDPQLGTVLVPWEVDQQEAMARVAEYDPGELDEHLISCTRCGLEGFRYVPERKHPRLCMDCADLTEAGI